MINFSDYFIHNANCKCIRYLYFPKIKETRCTDHLASLITQCILFNATTASAAYIIRPTVFQQ